MGSPHVHGRDVRHFSSLFLVRYRNNWDSDGDQDLLVNFRPVRDWIKVIRVHNFRWFCGLLRVRRVYWPDLSKPICGFGLS